MLSKRSTPSSSEGVSLIELLVALSVTLAVTAGGLGLALSSLGLYETDHARIRLNQNLRATQDFLTADVRQAGELLGDDFPAIEISDGAAGAPDELVVRRNLLSTVLRSCRLVENGERRIYIRESPAPPPGCVTVPDSDADGWPDNHGAFRAFRLANGVDVSGETEIPAYIYDPLTGAGEFFTYRADDAAAGFIETPAGQVWQNSYPVSDQARVYLLEERRYRIAGGLLQVIVNGNDPSPLNLVERIEDLQAVAAMQDGSLRTSLGWADVWSDLQAIRLTLRGRVDYRNDTIEAVWSSEIMPRNILSH